MWTHKNSELFLEVGQIGLFQCPHFYKREFCDQLDFLNQVDYEKFWYQTGECCGKSLFLKPAGYFPVSTNPDRPAFLTTH